MQETLGYLEAILMSNFEELNKTLNIISCVNEIAK